MTPAGNNNNSYLCATLQFTKPSHVFLFFDPWNNAVCWEEQAGLTLSTILGRRILRPAEPRGSSSHSQRDMEMRLIFEFCGVWVQVSPILPQWYHLWNPRAAEQDLDALSCGGPRRHFHINRFGDPGCRSDMKHKRCFVKDRTATRFAEFSPRTVTSWVIEKGIQLLCALTLSCIQQG